MKNLKIVSKLKKIIDEASINWLYNRSVGYGLGIFFVGGIIGNIIIGGVLPEICTGFLFFLCCAAASFGAVVGIIRREAPNGRGRVNRGTYAVFSNWLWVAFCLVGFFSGLYVVITSIWNYFM